MKYKGFIYTPAPKTAWDNLSMQEKSEMIKVAVRNGITDLKTIKEQYNEFAEGGDTKDSWTMQDEASYKQWRDTLPDNLRNTNDNDYDMRAAFKAGMQPVLESDGYYHLGSRDPKTGRILKAPHHPTFLQALATDASMGYYPITDNKGQTYTQTWKGNAFAEGGKIHIKPENRGKFTALKERTGHSASWFKEHGTPAQKKMAVFALNSRHWKHGLGGNLFDGISEDTQQMQIGRPFWQSQAQEPTFMESLAEFNRQQELKRQQQRKTLMKKINTVGRKLAEENIRENTVESNDNIWVETPLFNRKKNPHLSRKAEEGAKTHAAWEKEHPNLTAWGNVASALPFAVAAVPLGAGAVAGGNALAATTAGQAVTSSLAPLYQTATGATIAGAPVLEWANAGLTSAFGAHGIQQAVEDGDISPMTALQIAPLYRPLTVLGSVGISKATPAVESFVERHPALYQYPRYAIGKFKYGFDAELPTLYRKFRNLPNVENGRITISNPNNRFAFDNGFGKESPIITNMATDAPVRSHGLGDWDRDLTLAFPGKTLLGKKVISTRPSDTFTYGNNISVPVKDVVGFTGRPKEITFLQNSGIRSVSSPEAEVFWESGAKDLSKQIRMWRTEHARRIRHEGINLGKNKEPSGDFRNYAATIENLTRGIFKSPTMKDYEFMDYVFRPKYASQTIPKVENFTIKSFDDYPLLGEWVGNTERRKYLEQPWRWSNVMYDPLTPVESIFRSNLNIGLKPKFKK